MKTKQLQLKRTLMILLCFVMAVATMVVPAYASVRDMPYYDNRITDSWSIDSNTGKLTYFETEGTLAKRANDDAYNNILVVVSPKSFGFTANTCTLEEVIGSFNNLNAYIVSFYSLSNLTKVNMQGGSHGNVYIGACLSTNGTSVWAYDNGKGHIKNNPATHVVSTNVKNLSQLPVSNKYYVYIIVRNKSGDWGRREGVGIVDWMWDGNAKVISNSYYKNSTVSYDAGASSGVSGMPSNETKVTGSTVTVGKAPTRTGYAFAGWKVTAGQVSGMSNTYKPGATFAMPAKNVTLTAQWTAGQQTITWDPQGGSVSPTSTKYAVGTKAKDISGIPTPTKPGYTFKYWHTDPAGRYVNKDSQTIFYEGNGGNWATTLSYENGSWVWSGNKAHDADEKKPQNSFTMYAQWEPNKYTVTWDANGGEITGHSGKTTYTAGDKESTIQDIPTPTRQGYKFKGYHSGRSGNSRDGWNIVYIDKDAYGGCNEAVSPNASGGWTWQDQPDWCPRCDFTMYAQWEKDTSAAKYVKIDQTGAYGKANDGKAIFWVANSKKATKEIGYSLFKDAACTTVADAAANGAWTIEMAKEFANLDFSREFKGIAAYDNHWKVADNGQSVKSEGTMQVSGGKVTYYGSELIRSGIYKFTITLDGGSSDWCYVVVPGDTDRSGLINLNDPDRIKRFINSAEPMFLPTDDEFSRPLADMQNDKKINFADSDAIVRIINIGTE